MDKSKGPVTARDGKKGLGVTCGILGQTMSNPTCLQHVRRAFVTADDDLISSDTLHGDESSGPAVSGVSGGALAASKALRGCGVGRSLKEAVWAGIPLGCKLKYHALFAVSFKRTKEGHEARPCSKSQLKDESRYDSSQRFGLAFTRSDDALIQQRRL